MVASCRRIPRTAARRLRYASWLTLSAALWTTGCASTHGQRSNFLRSHEVEVSSGSYVVRPPDTVAIHSADVPELDGASQTLRPDGKIVLRLLGEVDVAGLTTGEIAAKLKSLLSRYYVEPDVMVEVVGYRSKYFYIFGEVGSPGPRLYTGRDTLLKALAEAQPTFLAWRSQIKLTRPSAKEGEARTITVNLDDITKRGDLTNDILLQEGDVIEVPPTPMAWVGHRIREVLYPVGPLMSAYTLPAGPMTATHAYEDEFGSGDDGDRRRTQWPRY